MRRNFGLIFKNSRELIFKWTGNEKFVWLEQKYYQIEAEKSLIKKSANSSSKLWTNQNKKPTPTPLNQFEPKLIEYLRILWIQFITGFTV